MRQITVKFDGECSRCGAALEIGDNAMYEKRTGIFCPGCEPTEVEDIRAFRMEKAERKAERREAWAESAEKKSAQYNEESRRMMSVIPMGQPILIGHHSEKRDRRYRERAWNKMGKAVEESDKAQYHREKAQNLRRVQVAGDAERRRQAEREAMDAVLSKGSTVIDAVFGPGVIVGVYKKSYRIEFDRGFTYARDKSFVRPA